MSEFNFMEYVNLGVEKISKKPYAQNDNEFATNPGMCFFSVFLRERLFIMADISKSYPEYKQLVTRMCLNNLDMDDGRLPYLLREEGEIAIKIFSKNYPEEKNLPDSIFLFATVCLAVVTDFFSPKDTSVLIKQAHAVCALNVAKNEKEKLMIAVMLWFTDINGYRNAVKNKYIGLNNQEQSGKGCYIATAVYGSYDCPQVWTLRRYRDYSLAKYWYGRAFIHLYYAISPTIVKCFGAHEWFNKIFARKLDFMVENLKKRGYSSLPYDDKK